MAITLLAGFGIGWLIFSDAQPKGESSMEDHTDHEIWTCSMHPQIRQDGPGACPICGMDLIPVSSMDEQESLAISMSPTAMQLANVRTAVVGEMDPVKELRLNGRITEDERLVSSQTSHVPGRIERLLVNYTGEYVNRGQIIAYMYSPDLVTAQEELLEAQKISDRQPQLFNAAKNKLRNWKLSDAQIERILEGEEVMDQFPITADISGYVLEKNVNMGDHVQQGEPLYKIADLSKVWVVFDIYESDMTWVKTGDKINFTVQSYPGETFSGEITYVDPVINPQTRVAQARVEIQNRDNRLKPEMFVRGVVEARMEEQEGSIVVPKSAVMWTGERSVVYVKQSSGSGVNFELREVTLGPSLGEFYVIGSGLAKGEEIAVSGTFSIDAAAQLAGKPSMMNPGMADADEHGGNVQLSNEDREALQPLYRAYLAWKTALTEDDLDEAKSASGEFQGFLATIDLENHAGMVWKTYSDKMKKAFTEEEAGTIADIRKTFQVVSGEMIAMTRQFKPFPETLYVQYCPMADSNRGAYWLSTDESIRNPYYGESMLTCGEVTSEIN